MKKYKLNTYLSSLFIALFLCAGVAKATSYKYLDVTCSYQIQEGSRLKTFNWALLPDTEGRWVVKSELPISGTPELVRITHKRCMNTYSIKNISFTVGDNITINLMGQFFDSKETDVEGEECPVSKFPSNWALELYNGEKEIEQSGILECVASDIDKKNFAKYYSLPHYAIPTKNTKS